MKINYILALVLTIAFIDNFAQHAQDLNWLAGTWKIETKNGHVVETWRVDNDSTLLGKSIFVKSSKDSIPQESVELSFRKGEWSYIPTAIGQNNDKPVPFKFIFLKGTEFICENPEHDFPQRISYRRIGDQLYASIEGQNKGKFAKRNFDFMKE